MSSKYKGTAHISLLPMATLLSMPITELVDMAKVVVQKSESAKTLQADNKASVSALGKVIAAMKRKFNDSDMESAMTFTEFWQMKTGEKKVNNHAESCGKCYGLFVDNQLITEKDYDANPADNLQKAAAIATKCEADITRREVLDAADILKERHKDAAKKLQAILDKLNGPKTVDGETAKEQLALIFASGLHVLVFAALGAEIHHEKDLEKLRLYMEHTDLLVDAIPEKTRETILRAQAPANAQPSRTAAAPAQKTPEHFAQEMLSQADADAIPDYEGWVRTHLEGIAEDEIRGAVSDLAQYHAHHGQLPKDAEEFLATPAAA